jgi:nucleotide-binding universal stress UspA family protein
MKILVPTDFSENANDALEFAKKIAQYQESSITLLFAFYAVYDFASQAELIVDNIEQDAKKIMEDTKKLGLSEGFNIDYLIIQGTVSSAITSTAYRENYDLIVMGTQGKNSGVKKIFGTNTGHVIQESKVPVLAVPNNATWNSINKITISSELKEDDHAYFDKLMRFVANWKLPIELLHINKFDQKNIDQKNKEFTSFFSSRYPEVPYSLKIINSTEILSGIISYLDDNSEALLVMFYKKKSFFEHLFNKSQSLAISNHIKTPLLILY